MSESTTVATPVNPTAAFESLPWWADATPEQRTAIIADHIRSGIAVEEYVIAAANWPSAAELVAEIAGADAAERSPGPSTAHLERMLASVQRLQAEVDAEKAPAAGAAVAAGAAEAAAAAEEAEEKARADAKATLKAAVKAFRQGERALKAGFLEAGRLADVYVHQRLALGDKRDAAVRQVELALSEHSSDRVEPNRLIACYHAYRLLAEEPGVKADAVPYGHYRDAWVQLCVRRDEGKPGEYWTLLEGSEVGCLTAFAAAVKDGLSKAACVDKAKAVVAEYVRRRAEATEAAAAETRRQAVAAAAAQTLARQTVEEAARKAEQAQKAAQQAQQEEDKAALTAAANAALEEQRAAQRAQAVAIDEAVAAQREQAQADATAKAAKDAADKAAEKARKAAEKANKPPAAAKNVPPAVAAPAGETPELPHKPEPQSAPVRKQIAAAGAKDAADVLAEAIAGHETPDDVLYALVEALHGKYAKALSKPAGRVVEAAMVQIRREQKRGPSPVQVSEAQLVADGVAAMRAAAAQAKAEAAA
jgi:SWI/SNF-related matrix-associated actin-dependent regulator 1 of chromatin subfamily A